MKLSSQILLAFAVVLVLSIADTLSNYFLSVKVEKNTQFLNKSQEIIRNSSNLHKEIITMQSSFRGFLLTFDTLFLTGYKEGLQNVPQSISTLRQLVNGNREQLRILDSIQSLHQRWVGYSKVLVDSRKTSKINDSTEITFNNLLQTTFKNRIGEKINNEVSNRFLEFDRQEYRERDIHSTNLISSIKRTHQISLFFFVLTIVVGLASTFYIMSTIIKRIRKMVHFAEDISHGNFATIRDHRTDEMTGLIVSLNRMSESLNKNINQLKRRNYELDKFAHVVSHDLKAPVRGIHNVVAWMEEDFHDQLTPELKKHLDIIRQRTRRMEDLINGLLEYARLRQEAPMQETDLNILVNEIAETLVPRSVDLVVQPLPVIVTERIRLEQIFSNLISNAVKYGKPEGGEIIVSCKTFQSHFEFSVRDNGVGIEPEYHARIFEMFQTLRDKDQKESTGIGLAIVKKILDDKQCTINVYSQKNEGTEFVFTWPKI